MNIKSLLLGSAAALAVVSGAHAADAIVAAEPEPAEYVKVCDAFGTGYFYIPGTETCLKIGGMVRYDVSGGEYLGLDNTGDGVGDTWAKTSRFELRVATASDTEYGALKTAATIRNNNNSGVWNTFLEEATISLGGFLVGQTDSLFTTGTGYAGDVINDGNLTQYGPFETQQIRYTYDAGNGLTVAASLEDTKGLSKQDYVPTIVGNVAYTNGTFGVSAVAGYDAVIEEGAFKARVDGKFGGVSAWLMGAVTTDSPTVRGGRQLATWGGQWAVWGGIGAPISDNLAANIQASYDDFKDVEVSANVKFTVASGFVIEPEVAYIKNGLTDADAWGGMVRFQRNF